MEFETYRFDMVWRFDIFDIDILKWQLQKLNVQYQYLNIFNISVLV